MQITKYEPGKITIQDHLEVCQFIYSSKEDLMRHLQYSDYTTIYVFRKDGIVVGSVQIIWKREHINLPIEESFSNGEKIRLECPAVEIAGLKLDLPTNEIADFLPEIDDMLTHETEGYSMYLTCDVGLENLYRRKFRFKSLGRVTFDNKNWFSAMKRDPQ